MSGLPRARAGENGDQPATATDSGQGSEGPGLRGLCWVSQLLLTRHRRRPRRRNRSSESYGADYWLTRETKERTDYEDDDEDEDDSDADRQAPYCLPFTLDKSQSPMRH